MLVCSVATIMKPKLLISSSIGFFSSYVYGDTTLHQTNSDSPNDGNAQNTDTGIADAVHVQHNGTKLSNMSFPEIWQYALESVEEPCEQETTLLNTLREISSGIPVEEDPLFGETVNLVISGEMIETDLIWEQARVMVFLSDNEANYNKAKSANWRCFYTDDPSVTANEVLTTIKGEH